MSKAVFKSYFTAVKYGFYYSSIQRGSTPSLFIENINLWLYVPVYAYDVDFIFLYFQERCEAFSANPVFSRTCSVFCANGNNEEGKIT